jgi:hypothetical protein
MPWDHLRPFIRGIRLTFPPHATLTARGLPIDWGDHALRSAIKGLFLSDFEISSSPQHALAKASAPLRLWVDWPQTRRNLAAAHRLPPRPSKHHPLGLWLSGVIYSLSPFLIMGASWFSCEAFNMLQLPTWKLTHNSCCDTTRPLTGRAALRAHSPESFPSGRNDRVDDWKGILLTIYR